MEGKTQFIGEILWYVHSEQEFFFHSMEMQLYSIYRRKGWEMTDDLD